MDIIIVGAGITGAFLAERMTRAGWSVAVLDRRAPQKGATAASTALVMWETDCPLIELEQRIGFEAAAMIWRRCFAAIQAMFAFAPQVGAHVQAQESLYLAGDRLDPTLLKLEGELRRRANLPSHWKSGEAVWARDAIIARAALRSAGAASLDPIQFSRALLKAAERRGAYIYDNQEVEEIDPLEAKVRARTRAGVHVSGRALVLATGYEMPDFVPKEGRRVDSTWVVATPYAGPERPLVWEASSVYAYMRTVQDHIIIGGEDEPGLSAEQRDARMAVKAKTLTEKLRALAPDFGEARPDLIWSAFFGSTEDGLPLIGPIPGAPRTFAAYGYGGNGITFSVLAAELLFRQLLRKTDPIERFFALDRF